MLDWAARIDDVASQLSREYAVDDRVAIEILLSALVACPRTPASWLILETNWYSRECREAWFSFGEQWLPYALPQLRARSPWRVIEALTIEWLDSPGEERLFIEPDFERYPRFHRLTQAQYLLQRTLRVRTHSWRAAHPLRSLDQREEERRTDELSTLARGVLEDRVGARPADPPDFREPPQFLYHVELVQRLAPWYLDWNTLVRAFGALAVRRAYLEGRRETGPEANQAMARAAADSIPPWIVKALRRLLDAPSKSATLENLMGLREETRRSGHGARQELIRLRRNGVIEWHPQKMHWALKDDHRQGILDVLNGHAFGAA